MIVEDVMSINPMSIGPLEFVTRARDIMRDYNFQSLPVVEEDGKVMGMITIQDVINVTSTKSDVTVNGYIRQDVPTISPSTDIAKAASVIINTEEGRLPVVDEDSRLIGVLSIVDIFEAIDELKIVDEPVSKYMTSRVIVCEPDDPISRVWLNMIEYDITGFPVVRKNQEVMGMITREDIMKRGYVRIERESEGTHKKPPANVQHIMSTPAITVDENDSIKKVASIFKERHIGRVPVTRDNKLTGIVDRYDVIRACRRPMSIE